MQHTVVVWPDNRLLRKAELVTEFDEKLTQLVIDMHQVMKKDNGAGLAASQIGINKQVLCYSYGMDQNCMINPSILEKEGEDYLREGCLSFPGVSVKAKRATKIKVKFDDVDGVSHIATFKEYIARIIQHEIDHINGKTFLIYLSKIKRDIVTGKMKKAKKKRAQILKAARALPFPQG